jgi:hypothetical protein
MGVDAIVIGKYNVPGMVIGMKKIQTNIFMFLMIVMRKLFVF